MLFLRSRTICCQIFKQIGQRVPRTLQGGCAERDTGSGLRIDPDGVIDEIGVKAARADLLRRQVAGELIYHGGDHFSMGELLGPDIVAKIAHLKNAVNTGFLHYTPYIRYTQVTDWDKPLIGCLRMFIIGLFFTDYLHCSLFSKAKSPPVNRFLVSLLLVHTEVMHI